MDKERVYLHNTLLRNLIKLNTSYYKASRLIFLWHHGYLPKNVDHIDRNTTNDRIENLRAATIQQNSFNRNSLKNSSSQYIGVCFYKRDKTWEVQIRVEGKRLFLGRYKTEEEAALVRNKAAVKYHGEFASINIIKPKK